MADSAKLRLVRCPKCENLLPELADYSVYQCGGCGTVLRANHRSYGSDSLSEKSDEGKIEGDSTVLVNSLQTVDSSDTSDVDVKPNGGSIRYNEQRESEKENNGHQRFPNQTTKTDENFEYGIDFSKTNEDPKSQIGPEKRSKFPERMSNWQNGERGEMEGPWRKPRAGMDGVRFSTSNYPDEGTSSIYSGFSYGEQRSNPKDMDSANQVRRLEQDRAEQDRAIYSGFSYGEQRSNPKDMDSANQVRRLEQDRAELLRKLDELKDQLTQSCEVGNHLKEKVRVDGRMIPPDPYCRSDTWYPEGSSGLNRTSRQFFGPDKQVAGPSYFSYPPDPYAYTNSHEMAMPNFHPSIHNPNHMSGYGDPYASQMLRRGPHQLSHQFRQPPLHPYFPGHYIDTNPESYESYGHNPMLHPPSCSCFHCYDNKRRASAPVPPASFINNRYPDAPNDPMSYHHEIPGAYGPQIHNSRTAIPPGNFRETQSHTGWPSDLNSDMGGFVRNRPQKVMVASGSRRCHPIASGAPFITCYNCFELLQLPKKALVMSKNHWQKVQCGACSSEISFSVVNKKLVLSPHSEMKGFPAEVDDSSNEFLDNRVSHSQGHAARSGANFSSDDYSGYDFHSVDREPVSLAADRNSNSTKAQEMHSFHSASVSTSEDENSLEVVVSPREVTKSIQRPTTASPSPPPAGSPLQEHFDYSNNNHAVNRFGKGNRSSRSEQDKAKDKLTVRQNSLNEAALATEMDVHDYSNTGVSQDSGDGSREHDLPKSNKGGDSFFANIIKKSFRTNQTDEHGKCNVTINGQPVPDRVLKKAEKLAGPIQPGNYWYDFRAGFWGVMGGPCLGIILPHIEEFNHPMPDKCAGGNTGVFVNGRELHQRDLDLLVGRGLPTERDRSYIIEISGRVLDEDTGEELDSLGKLAPTVEKARHGFGMKAPRTSAAS